MKRVRCDQELFDLINGGRRGTSGVRGGGITGYWKEKLFNKSVS